MAGVLNLSRNERSPLMTNKLPSYLSSNISDDESVYSVDADSVHEDDLDEIDENYDHDVEELYDDRLFEDDAEEEEEDASSVSSIEEPLRSHCNNHESWRNITFLAFSSLGAIYGDIGTSPLYVINTIMYPQNQNPSKEDVYGAVSVIFYLFTLIVIGKYLLVVLVYGPNNGEGGLVAIYAKIARQLHIGPRGVAIATSLENHNVSKSKDHLLLTRQVTSQSFISLNRKLDQVKSSPWLLLLLSNLTLGSCFLGCSLVMADGLLTPTTSVLSAIQGIKVAKPEFDHVLIVSELVLAGLFALQQFGSAKISIVFAPIILCWLLGLFLCGLYNIVVYDPNIWYSLSPYYAYKTLMNGGVDVLSGAMLAITGTEAMFADIGHFGRVPVQLSLTAVVYPALIVCYLGQGAFLINLPEAIANPFFMSIPGGLNSRLYWVMFSLATLSTIIASQALILGVFSIISQLIHLDCFPKFKIIHVDEDNIGKVYIPSINWMLMVGVLATTAWFRTSENVTAAYGLGISLDFLVTSFLILVCLSYVYEVHIIYVLIFAIVFVPLEVAMVGANLNKIPNGAWFSILMAGIFLAFFYFWSWARSKKLEQEFSARVKIVDLYPEYKRAPPKADTTLDLSGKPTNKQEKSNQDNSQQGKNERRGRSHFRFQQEFEVEYDISLDRISLVPSRNAKELKIKAFTGTNNLKRYDGVGIMYTEALHTLNSPNTVPHLYKDIIESFTCIPSVFIFCAIKVLSIPTIEQEKDRILIGSMKLPGHYRCIVRFGFAEEVEIQEEMISRIIARLPQTPDLMHKFRKPWGKKNTDSIPILHIFANELIQAHEYDEFENVNIIKRLKRSIRSFLINGIFSPMNSAFRSKGIVLKVDDENIDNQRRLFVGTVVRI